MLKSVCAALIMTLLPVTFASSAPQDPLFNAEGYRSTLYRSPTPKTHALARTLEPQQLLELQFMRSKLPAEDFEKSRFRLSRRSYRFIGKLLRVRLP